MLPALFILELLSRRGVKLSDLLRPLENEFFITGELNSTVDEPQARMKLLAERYANAEQHTLDGISILYPDWHFNVRSSNTEPLLRLNLEALDRETMERRREEVLAIIRG
jgi:phosphomannomutase